MPHLHCQAPTWHRGARAGRMNIFNHQPAQLLWRMIVVTVMPTILTTHVVAQGVSCDPNKILSAERCAKCHHNEVAVWKTTPHFQTFEQLSRSPEAKEISKKLGLRSVKRSNLCINCHYTPQNVSGQIKPVSGISCESCHGAARDWISTHSDYGGPLATKATETPDHAVKRY